MYGDGLSTNRLLGSFILRQLIELELCYQYQNVLLSRAQNNLETICFEGYFIILDDMFTSD